ncbi:membrane skeletal protein, putative [Babesia bigemina]|uniref:Membrane skeletal protein, putative n=1 Tax=Babesia bigemina TaxID=5866 RepID=A0A061DCB8_BABBI|nr:membrane skeletal protein, putative [Babesia bigemina]CDR97707.1 membrane skeletal protein, putative [Babesia bigemina]|eukprot:XP_012769893.1 membrane skeletal protein, putative [Babesia bigemina]
MSSCHSGDNKLHSSHGVTGIHVTDIMDVTKSSDTESTCTNPDLVQRYAEQLFTLDKKPESLYECPTSACSIASVGAQQDAYGTLNSAIFNTQSLDSSDEEPPVAPEPYYSKETPSIERATNLTTPSKEIGSPVFTYQQAVGGYFAGSPGTLLVGSGTLSERPKNFIAESTMGDATPLRQDITEPATVVMTPCSSPYGAVGATILSPNVSERNIGTESPLARECHTPMGVQQGTPLSRISASTSPAVKDYSRAVECSNNSETSFVHEGYDTVQIPRYRPVEVVDKVVEVPVVHHVDTYVPKKEIQEIESFVKKPYTKYVDKFIEVPEVHYSDRIVEVPEYHEITKTVTKVEVQERIKYVPKVEVKVVPKYVEVPVIKIVDRYEEYEEVEEVIKEVEKVEIVDVPREVVKHVVKPVKKIIEQERIIPVNKHRDVPVEKVKFVPKIETVEVIREVPKIIDVPVPYNVHKIEYVDKPYIVPEYRDVQVGVPVRKRVTPIYRYEGEPEIIDLPVHKPYFVIHDHITFKPAAQPISEKIKVVGSRPIDLNTLTTEDRVDAQERMHNAVNQRPLEPHDERQEMHHLSTQLPMDIPNARQLDQYGTQPRHVQIGTPISHEKPVHKPQFGAPEMLSSNSNKSSVPMETIIYMRSPKGRLSPMSDGGAIDVYPHSNNNTPRMAN